MAVVHIGDGRHIELDEGAASRPPQPPKPKQVRFKEWESKSTKSKKKSAVREHPHLRGESNPWHRAAATLEGYAEWHNARTLIFSKYRDVGAREGEYQGIRRSKQGYYKGWAKRRAKIDMENIKKVIPDLDDMASEALFETLTVLRGPTSQQQKLAAAKLLLEYTKAKPVAKSEVTVNAAEAWLASIADNE